VAELAGVGGRPLALAQRRLTRRSRLSLDHGLGCGLADDPVASHIERLAELESIGCDQFAVYLMHDDEDAILNGYGSEMIPALSRSGGLL
jgi:hypothetical protein